MSDTKMSTPEKKLFISNPKYCPECGSEEIRTPELHHNQCEKCLQEFFDDVDYSDCYPKILRKRTSTISSLESKLAELERQLAIESSEASDRSQEANHYNWLDEQNEKLTEKLADYEGALKYYGDDSSWFGTNLAANVIEPKDLEPFKDPEYVTRGGKQAREVLKKHGVEL